MENVFARLAAKLDELPHGFPSTESGVELRILEKIFSPEDAEMALRLLPLPETVEAISPRVGLPVEPLRAALDGMAERGQILVVRLGGKKLYMLAPFVIGHLRVPAQPHGRRACRPVRGVRPHAAPDRRGAASRLSRAWCRSTPTSTPTRPSSARTACARCWRTPVRFASPRASAARSRRSSAPRAATRARRALPSPTWRTPTTTCPRGAGRSAATRRSPSSTWPSAKGSCTPRTTCSAIRCSSATAAPAAAGSSAA